MIFSKNCTCPGITQDGKHQELFPDGTWVKTIEESFADLKARPDLQPEFLEAEHKKFLEEIKKIKNFLIN